MIAALSLLLAGTVQAGTVPNCEYHYPIAGTAGYANAVAARRTTVQTYSASAFAERALAEHLDRGRDDGGSLGRAELNLTFGAARVPTWCGDSHVQPGGADPAPSDVLGFGGLLDERAARMEQVYLEPFDLKSTNIALAGAYKGFGAFYSAAVTEASLSGGNRWLTLPATAFQVYPLFFAPVLGDFQRGDGVNSFAMSWVGGAWVDTKWVGARAGYTGSRGLYGSVDERFLGLFGNIGLSPERSTTPWSFLETGLHDVSLRTIGQDRLAKKTGFLSLYLRDLPYGDDLAAVAGVVDAGRDPAGRLRTLHAAQESILERWDVELALARLPRTAFYEGHVGWHSDNWHPAQRQGLRQRERSAEGWMLKAGLIQVPAQYSLGVEGGRYASLRAAYRKDALYMLLLFNDPEQLALYPFATNALTLRLGVGGPLS